MELKAFAQYLLFDFTAKNKLKIIELLFSRQQNIQKEMKNQNSILLLNLRVTLMLVSTGIF
jgi:hypothetical protein